MNKKVLIITPFFAPETHAAVFRAHKLVKYLKRMGWEPSVLTVDINYVYNEDPGLLKELEGVPIYRSSYIEPSIRGLKMALGGPDRTFKTLKASGALNTSTQTSKQSTNNAPVERSTSSKLYNYILKRYLNKPDRFWTWEKGAIKKAKEIIEKENISMVYTTCLPFTTNKIGIALKKSLNIKWVADFRDPITYGKRFHSSIPKIYKLQRQIQDDTFKYADQVVTLSSSYGLIFSDQYSGEYDHKHSFIPTGLDDDYIPAKEEEKTNTFLFIGEYLKEYKGHFFSLYKKAIEGLTEDQIPKILIIGRKDVNERVVNSNIEGLGIEKYIIFHDHMPQSELYKFVEKSRFTLLINGAYSLWWCSFAKLVDYIALKKRVVAFIPAISEARSELSKSGLGVFLNYDDESALKLKQIILEKDHQESVNKEYCKRYLASSQVKSFIEIFENL